MPSQLLTLKTDLTSLKYGQDRPRNGSSNQPYIQSPLPQNATVDQRRFYELIRTSLDWPVRGGTAEDMNGLPIPLTAKQDAERISKFINSFPRGKAFIDKQVFLQQANPKTEVGVITNANVITDSSSFLSQLVANANFGSLEYTRVYNNGANTLRQIAAMGSGAHFDRSGNVAYNPFQLTYAYTVGQQNRDNDSTNNRLRILYELKINSQGNVRMSNLQQAKLSLETINKLGLSRSQDLIQQYQGGPNSTLGNGYTYVRRFTNTTGLLPKLGTMKANISPTLSQFVLNPPTNTEDRLYKFINEAFISGSVSTGTSFYKYDLPKETPKKGSTTELIQRYVDTQSETSNPYKSTLTYKQIWSKTKVQGQVRPDFRVDLPADSKIPNTNGYSDDSRRNNIAYKNGIGNPGSKGINRAFYSKVGGQGNDQGVDSINLADVGVNPLDDIKAPKDLVTFIVKSVEIQPNSTYQRVPLAFRAFISNMRDNHSAEYSAHKYVGRGENFYTYSGFSRDISFTLKIAAQSRVEMKPLYKKVNYLISQLYPGYSEFTSGKGNGFMRSPLVTVTVGDFISEQPGFFRAINVTVDDNYPWEIVNDPNGEDKDMYQLPQMLTLDISFTPIHNFLPRRSFWLSGDNYNITPFYTPNVDNSGTNNLLAAAAVGAGIAVPGTPASAANKNKFGI